MYISLASLAIFVFCTLKGRNMNANAFISNCWAFILHLNKQAVRLITYILTYWSLHKVISQTSSISLGYQRFSLYLPHLSPHLLVISTWVSLLQLFLGRARFLAPCGFLFTACCVMFVAGFLRVCPIQLHSLFLAKQHWIFFWDKFYFYLLFNFFICNILKTKMF